MIWQLTVFYELYMGEIVQKLSLLIINNPSLLGATAD
jgi:hypothetical protein